MNPFPCTFPTKFLNIGMVGEACQGNFRSPVNLCFSADSFWYSFLGTLVTSKFPKFLG